MKGEVLLFLLLLGTLMHAVPRTEAQTTNTQTTLSVVPPPVETWAGQNFTVSVKIYDVTNMQYFQFKISWDPSLINYVSHIVFPPWPPPIIIIDPQLNEAEGYLIIGAFVSPGNPAVYSGSATLANVTFHAVKSGIAWITLSETNVITDPPVTIQIENAAFTILGVSIEWNKYHNYTEIVDTLLEVNLSYPNIADVFSIGKSWQNRTIYCVRLTNESNTDPKPKVFFVGYHHAREFITAELTLYFIVEAVTKFGVNETITRMLNCSEIYIIPALNVDGFDAVKQNEWQRKNSHPFDEDGDGRLDEDPPDDENGDGYIEDLFFSNATDYYFIRWEGVDNDGDGLLNEDWVGGVDLNRNYGYQWNATCDSGSPYPQDEDFRGLAPFSEPETQALRDFAMSQDFRYAISFHSGARNIVYPWGYTTSPTLNDAIFRQVAANLSVRTGAPYYQSGQWYTTSGVWDDWMYDNRSAIALTCEIYENNSAWQYEPGPYPDTWWERGITQAFNPDPADIETTVQNWLPVFYYITERAVNESFDTAVTSILSQKTVVGQGYLTNVNVTVANQGAFTENLSLAVYVNTTCIVTKNFTLNGASSTTAMFAWNTTGFAYGNYSLWAYVTPLSGETHTTDNTLAFGILTVTIPGDFSGDLKISPYDFALLAAAYGSTPKKPNWNPNCDVNSDGKVGPFDFAILSSNFGKQWP
jgi:hypothetical protein